MQQEVPELFDPVKSRLAETRARRIGPATFLLERAAEDLVDRLAAVQRDFESALDIGTPDAAFGKALEHAGQAKRFQSAAEPEPAEEYALIISGMMFHQVNDLPGLMIRLRRALKPDGLMLAAFPGGDTLVELRDCLMRAESEIRGAAALRVFPMIDVRIAGQLLQRAGFALPVTDSDRIVARYADMLALVRDLRAMGGNALPLKRDGQPPLTREIAARAAAIYAERYADPDGRIRATFEIVWMSGWAPHESQQKPLKPGSAKMRLADALAKAASKAGGETGR